MTRDQRAAHSHNSVLREVILEHLFVGQLLKRLWERGIYDVEVLRSEFDAGGYDLVVSRGELTRHVQLKAKRSGGATREFSISVALATRPSGCVLCFEIDDDLNWLGYRYFGEAPGIAMQPISEFKIAKHTKANADGVKSERPALRRIPLSRFARLETIDDVIEALIGPLD